MLKRLNDLRETIFQILKLEVIEDRYTTTIPMTDFIKYVKAYADKNMVKRILLSADAANELTLNQLFPLSATNGYLPPEDAEDFKSGKMGTLFGVELISELPILYHGEKYKMFPELLWGSARMVLNVNTGSPDVSIRFRVKSSARKES